MQQRLFRYGFVGATLAVILLLTLSPTSAEPTYGDVWCLACGQLGGRDLALNVVLFLPLGFALGVAGFRGRLALPLVAAVTLAIELLQMHIIAGRDASLGDLIANAAGGTVGYLVGTHRGRLLRPPQALARRLTLAAASFAAIVLLSTAWAVQPSLPRTRYYAQWAADMSNFGHFTGSIISARAGTEAFPPIGEIVASDRFRERLLGGQAPLSARVVPSAAQEPRLSPIVSVFDQRRREIVLLGQEEHRLVFRMRTRSADALFPSVGVRLSEIFEHPADEPRRWPDTVLVAGGLLSGRLWLLGAWEGGTRGAELTVGPEIGWFFLLPWQYELGKWAGLLSATWVAGIFFPLAYWAGMSRDSGGGGWLAVPVVVAVLSLGLLPQLLGYEPADWPAWLSAVGASLAGWAVAVRGGRRARQS